ncbi:MAG: hypothetical protein JWN20_197 [Jatrophihabitantaceae bacterium]|nr:hypothetical protein [Jatrophihabitantaceae bacterium]
MRLAVFGLLAIVGMVASATAGVAGAGADPLAGPAAGARAVPGAMVPLAPQRVIDTRIGQGGSTLNAGSTLRVQALGVAGVPDAGVSAVVLNLTATGGTESGWIAARPSGAYPSTLSSLNFEAAQTVANLAIVRVGSDGGVALQNGSPGRVDLVVDVSGYYLAGPAQSPGTFVPVSPSRLYDTRFQEAAMGGVTLAPRVVRALQISGTSEVPANGVGAVAMNVTATGGTAAGYLTVRPSGQTPSSSNLNFVPGQSVPNFVVVALGSDGRIEVVNGSSGAIDVVIDIIGYYLAKLPDEAGTLVALPPARVLDTRTGAPLGPGGDLALPIAGLVGRASSVVLNLTATDPSSDGYVTAWAGGTARPLASNLNFAPGRIVPNLVIVPVGADGTVLLHNGSGGTVHLIADVFGYVRAAPLVVSVQSGPVALEGPIRSLTCPVVGFCAALAQGAQTYVMTAGGWQLPVDNPESRYVDSLSCYAAARCTASQVGPGPGLESSTYSFDGSTWTVVAHSPGVRRAMLDCQSATQCAAVEDRFVWRFDGSQWAQIAEIDLRPEVFVCASPSFCIAGNGFSAVVLEGSAWSSSAGLTPNTAVYSAACASVTFCAFGGNRGAVTFDGATWTQWRDITMNAGTVPLVSMSCPAVNRCLAGDQVGFLYAFNGTGWTTLIPGPAEDSAVFVSCPTVERCYAISADGHAQQLAIDW